MSIRRLSVWSVHDTFLVEVTVATGFEQIFRREAEQFVVRVSAEKSLSFNEHRRGALVTCVVVHRGALVTYVVVRLSFKRPSGTRVCEQPAAAGVSFLTVLLCTRLAVRPPPPPPHWCTEPTAPVKTSNFGSST